MNPLLPRPRKPVLSRFERLQEFIVLGICLLACLGIFIKIVFL